MPAPEAWWRGGVLYQVYPRSFADSDGDGHGDLQGVIDHLEHLSWLGVDGIWLNPIHPSPNADWGYDVADYRSVAPEFGDPGTLDRLVAAAGERGIRVVLDLVPNHTSDRHPWFLDARSGRSAAHRDWYVWADGGGPAAPPNNWRSTFGGPAWTWEPSTEQWYLHNFLAAQPDLNWWNEDVRAAFDDVLRFWFDRGIAGFRIDVAHGIVKDLDLRDNPPIPDDADPKLRALGQRPEFNMNRPEVHEVMRRWRAIAAEYDPEPLLMGETWVLDIDTLAAFYGRDDELHLAQNFPFMFADPGEGWRRVVEATEARLPEGAWPVWAGSNHDGGRFPTRWAGGDERIVRASLLLLLTLRGTPILYYGDEIGVGEVEVARERLLDPVGIRGWPQEPGRDRMRAPMPWGPDGGFTAPGVEAWLPEPDPALANVAAQRDDAGSILHLCRDLIALRRDRSDLRDGASGPVAGPPGVWAWRRGADTVVAINHQERQTELAVDGRILIGTGRARDGETVSGTLRLDGWEGAVVEISR
ncbi:MAG TPA: alpha-amylase family glycosyl hydrolase [Actinomycetota bacterium]